MRKLTFEKGIATVLALIILAGVFVIAFSITLEYDLVQENYYEADLNYQSMIDARKRTGSLIEQPEIRYEKTENRFLVQFPNHISPEQVTGNVLLYRPSNADDDKLVKLQLDDNCQQLLSIPVGSSGLWVIKLTWIWQEQLYYKEEKISIPHYAFENDG